MTGEEIAAPRPSSAGNSPAEILFDHIDLDQRDFPETQTERIYIRYKIYDPERAAAATRLRFPDQALDDSLFLSAVQASAQLTLPDGETRLFGREILQRWTTSRKGPESGWLGGVFALAGDRTGEFRMVVPGVQAGAVLDVQVIRHIAGANRGYSAFLQHHGVPNRSLLLKVRIPNRAKYLGRPVLINPYGLRTDLQFDDDTGTFVIRAADIPPLGDEAFPPPLVGRGLMLLEEIDFKTPYVYPLHRDLEAAPDSQRQSATMLNADFARRKDASMGNLLKLASRKDGYWATTATIWALYEADVSEGWPVLASRIASFSGDSPSRRVLAGRIHDYVQSLWLRHEASPRVNTGPTDFFTATPDQVMDFERFPRRPFNEWDFVFLAAGLYKAAGIRAETIMLPSSDWVLFSPDMDNKALLDTMAVRVELDGAWVYSQPTTGLVLPFGTVHWRNAGFGGLRIGFDRAEFVPVPFLPAAQTRVENRGEFSLGDDGSLAGSGTRVLTGYEAINLRASLNAGDSDHDAALLAQLKEQLGADSVKITATSGLADDSPAVSVSYAARWDHYVTRTRHGALFAPLVFERGETPPFIPETRLIPVYFPFPRTVVDRFHIHLPRGMVLKVPTVPDSLPAPDLGVEYEVAYHRRAGVIDLGRTFTSTLSEVPASTYPAMKARYDAITRADGFLFEYAPAPPKPATPVPPAPGTPAAAPAR